MTAVIGEAPTRTMERAPAREVVRRLARPGDVAGMHGRDAEWRVIRDLLRRTRSGAGGVVLVEGERGIGKSLLLRKAARAASQEGFSLAAGAADRLGGQLPLFALKRAFGCPAGADPRPEPDYLQEQIREFRENLVHRAAAAPLMVTLDDLQWASDETLLALRVLPRELAGYPVAWILARSAGQARSAAYREKDAECMFSLLEGEGAVRVVLRPLPPEVTAGMLAGAFSAPPEEGLVGLAASAGGNPSLLTGLIDGLREEDAIRVRDGRASLVKVLLPRRVSNAARQWLGELTAPALQFLSVAALLGDAFELSDAMELLGAAPTALLGNIGEAVDAGILVSDDDSFTFRHGLLARAAAELIPPPARRALHRRFGEILLRRGDSVATAATHLLKAAQAGDTASLAGLDTAAMDAAPASPQTAADLALRALELTSPADAIALGRAITAAEMLTAAGRPAEAARIAYATLAQPIPADAEARLRCALSSVLFMTGQTLEAASEARKALALNDLGGTELDCQVQERARAVLIRVGAGPATDEAMTAEARTAEAMTRWNLGRVSEALELLREAARDGFGVSPDARHCQPLLMLCARLIDLWQLDEALSLIHAAQGRLPHGCLPQVLLSLLRSRVYLAQGKLDKAAAEGGTALADATAVGADAYAAAVHYVLGAIALRQADHGAAARHTARAAVLPTHVAMEYAPAQTVMTAPQVAEADDGAAAALDQLGGNSAGLAALRPALLADSVAGAWLVRISLAEGKRVLAASVAVAVGCLATDNPGWRTMTAAAVHVRGLLTGSSECLSRAVAQHEDLWARASAAEDLALLHARRRSADQAVEYLSMADKWYSLTGAAADAARVRARLRGLGVRRRYWETLSDRPVTGWESLTGKERAVAELVAQGLTNRQTASRLYISRNTVAHHMRQAFRKLDIGSRVELARIVMEQSQPDRGRR